VTGSHLTKATKNILETYSLRKLQKNVDIDSQYTQPFVFVVISNPGAVLIANHGDRIGRKEIQTDRNFGASFHKKVMQQFLPKK
jgi:hypothetical protein